MLGFWIALDEGLRCEVNDMCKATGKMIIQYSRIWWCTIAHRMRRSSYRNGAFVFFSMYLAKNSIIVSLFEALSQVMCPICHFVVSHNVDKINMSLPCEKSRADQQFWIGRHPVACRYAHCWHLILYPPMWSKPDTAVITLGGLYPLVGPIAQLVMISVWITLELGWAKCDQTSLVASILNNW